MRVEFRLNAGPHERYADSFAQSLIGQTPRLTTRLTDDDPELGYYGRATVVDAKVIEDGAAVLITYEMPPEARDLVRQITDGFREMRTFVVIESATYQGAFAALFKTWSPDEVRRKELT